jgi:hypothetical protein
MPTAFVLIKCEEGAEDKIRRRLDKKDVKMDVQPTIGHYDLVAKVTSPSLEHLNETIEGICGNDKVLSTRVLLGMTQTPVTA